MYTSEITFLALVPCSVWTMDKNVMIHILRGGGTDLVSLLLWFNGIYSLSLGLGLRFPAPGSDEPQRMETPGSALAQRTDTPGA